VGLKFYEVAALRCLAADEQCPTLRRLQAIDRLAADCGLWFVSASGNAGQENTERFATECRKCGPRARREIVRLLRKLNKSKKRRGVQASAIQARLLFVRGVSLSKDLFRLNEHGQRIYGDDVTTQTATKVSRIDLCCFDDALRSV